MGMGELLMTPIRVALGAAGRQASRLLGHGAVQGAAPLET